jgi:PIN domain nuclease of toxin-antitoxin system
VSDRKRRRVREHAPTPAPRCYLESSALLAGLLEEDDAVLRAVQPHTTVLSALTLAEARRALQRALHAGRITSDGLAVAESTIAHFERECTILAVDNAILARAGRRFPLEPVRTLDAIHLASAERLDDPQAPITLLTRDARVRENAVLLGMRVG